MPLIKYQDFAFRDSSLAVIERANRVIAEYTAQGFKLTLRQLYYQFVSRDWLPNTLQNYNRLGSIINDARLAGMVDWEAIEDRTRNLAALAHWDSPSAIVRACAQQFHYDLWDSQPCRIEVWIEKEALAGVFERVCRANDVPFLCCRGYTSQSEMWAGSQRLVQYSERGQKVIILHFGDHDPSGIDMTRDITDRLKLFGVDLQLERLALNMDQVRRYRPPPNPAKQTDSRFAGYIKSFGHSSWELDALEPRVLSDLVETALNSYMDQDAMLTARRAQLKARRRLEKVAAEMED